MGCFEAMTNDVVGNFTGEDPWMLSSAHRTRRMRFLYPDNISALVMVRAVMNRMAV